MEVLSSPDEMLSTRQVAAMLGCKARTVRSYRSAGKLTARKYSNRMFRYRRADVEAFRDGEERV